MLSTRELTKVAEDLEAQGCRIRRTKSGYMVYPPNGVRAFAFHLTPSDENAERQLGRDIRNAGLVVPVAISLGKR